MRPVYVVSGGVSKFSKARPDKTFQAVVKEAYDYILADLGLEHPRFIELVDGSVASYFSDHFTRQLMAGIMVQDYLGLCPKPGHRVEGGGATGGICFQEGWKSVASGDMDICLAYGFETMSHVNTWKGNEFIALASDVSFDYPVGGFYSGYYAMMVTRHMKEFGTTVEQLAYVSVKNHLNAFYNPYSQKHDRLTVADVRNSPMVAWPLTRRDICVMSDGAAAVVLASEEGLAKLEKAASRTFPRVKVAGIGRGTDAMRMADRPHQSYDEFVTHNLLAHEDTAETRAYYKDLWDRGFRYPGVHSFRAGRMASKAAYARAGITDPLPRSASWSCTTPTPHPRSRPTRTWGCAATARAGRSPSQARHLCRIWIMGWRLTKDGGRRTKASAHAPPPRKLARRRVPGEPQRRTDRVRASRGRDGADAGGIRPVAAPGHGRQALRR